MDLTFCTPGRIEFGAGRIAKLGEISATLGGRALLVTGRGFLRASGLLEEIRECLGRAGLEVVLFDSVPPEPILPTVEQALDLCRSHRCDVVIAVGGGSALDVGKTAAALANASGSVREYFTGREVAEKGLPFIAVPTTAGTGSEVTSNAVLTDTELGIKTSIRSRHMYADVALIDPELTLHMSPELTAFSGMDALTQALEALVSRGSNPLTDALALDASARLISNLRGAYEHGDDLECRSEVALGSLMGGIAFANARLGLVHGMAHPLGVATGLPHGLICGILLPHVMQFNLPVSADKYGMVARSAKLMDTGDDNEVASLSLIEKVREMNDRVGISRRSRELRVQDESLLPGIVETTLASGSARSNPRTALAEDVEAILRAL